MDYRGHAPIHHAAYDHVECAQNLFEEGIIEGGSEHGPDGLALACKGGTTVF